MPGVHWGNNHSNKYGKVYQYDMEGNYVAEYKSIHQCRLYNPTDFPTIVKTINGYKSDKSKFLYSTKYYMKFPLNILKRKRNGNSKPIYQYDLNGKFIKEWESATIAAKEFNMSRGVITGCADKKKVKSKSACGYLWSFERFDKIQSYTKKSIGKKILQYDLDGNFIKQYDSVADASRETKVNRPSIIMCTKGTSRRQTAGGYIWKYKD